LASLNITNILYVSYAFWHDHIIAGASEKSVVSKGKAILLQAWTGPEGSRRLRLQDFKTIGT